MSTPGTPTGCGTDSANNDAPPRPGIPDELRNARSGAAQEFARELDFGRRSVEDSHNEGEVPLYDQERGEPQNLRTPGKINNTNYDNNNSSS